MLTLTSTRTGDLTRGLRARRLAGRPLALMIVATSLWGAAAACMAAVGAAGWSATPVAAGGAAPLLVFSAMRGHAPLREFRSTPRVFLAVGALEVLNLVCYVAALRIGPLPIVVALHLTGPVLMILGQIVRGRRAFTRATAAELAAVALALWLIAGHAPAGITSGSALAGCLLALASAVCVAALITVVVRESAGRAGECAAGLQLLTAAVLGAPLLATSMVTGSGPTAGQVIALAVIGALLLGPGFACYWLAAHGLGKVTTGLVGLNEALVASLVGALVLGAAVTAADLVAGALVLGAAALELGTAPAPAPDRHPCGPTRPPVSPSHGKPSS
jgi:drug/metabolite transporter (DMT)-like permease